MGKFLAGGGGALPSLAGKTLLSGFSISETSVVGEVGNCENFAGDI